MQSPFYRLYYIQTKKYKKVIQSGRSESPLKLAKGYCPNKPFHKQIPQELKDLLALNSKYALRYLLRAETPSIMGTSSSFDPHRINDHACASKEQLNSHSLCIFNSHNENLMYNSA